MKALVVRVLPLVLLVVSGCLDPLPIFTGEPIYTEVGGFSRKTILTGNTPVAGTFKEPAYAAFGPDGRLYVTSYTGTLYVITVDEHHDVVSVQERKPLGNRMLTGLAFDPWASPTAPVLYLVSNEPPIYGVPDFSGRLSRLSGSNLSTVTQLVDGLPRSAENHMTFAAVFGPDRRLYISQGGNTNHGTPAPGIFGNRPERPLSAAILAGDVRSPGFSGQDSLEVYAPGTRNAYGLCRHSNGFLYVLDQGGDPGFGGRPGPNGQGVIDVPVSVNDGLAVLLPGRYYGHPNLARGEFEWRADLADGTPFQPPLAAFPLISIATGLWAYDSPANNKALLGNLLVTTFGSNELHYVRLTPNGLSAVAQGVVTDGFFNPLSLTVAPDGTIYVLEAGQTLGFGGLGPAKISVLQPLEPAVGTWSSRADMPADRAEHAAVALGGRVVVVGGDSSGTPTNTAAAYDPATDSWTALPPIRVQAHTPLAGTPVSHAAAAVVDETLYYFGGLTQWPGPAVAEVWAYNSTLSMWTPRAQMPRPRGAMGVAVAGGKVYLFGGLADGEAVRDLTIYDPASNTWEDLSATHPMLTARDHFPAVLAPNGLIYCLGGRQKSIGSVRGMVEAFDPLERRWITGHKDMPTPRGGHAAAVLHGKIVVAGGEGASGPAGVFTAMEEYDPATNTWRKLTSMPEGRHGTQAVVIDDVMYLPGGGALQGGHQTTSMLSFSFP